MKILWIYKYDPEYNLDKWFHLEYARSIKRQGVDIVAYGPRIHEAYPDLVQIRYSPEMTWKELLNRTSSDIVILNTKSRMFEYYSPHTEEQSGCILPKGFNESKDIPKIMIEEDYHYEKNDDWYSDAGIDLILQRHCSQSLRKGKIESIWFPFSVDTEIFKDRKNPRKSQLALIGHATGPYPIRKRICNYFQSDNLIDIFCKKEKIYNSYISCLQEYLGYISTSSVYNITAAKNFEIMASGGILFTDKFLGIEKLFPNDSYIEIPKDLSILNSLVRDLLNNQDRIHWIKEKALNCILKYHSNFVRTSELLEIIKRKF